MSYNRLGKWTSPSLTPSLYFSIPSIFSHEFWVVCGPVSSQQACRLAGFESLDSLESRSLPCPTHSFFLPKRPVPLDPVPCSSCPRRGTYPLRQKLCLCRNSVSFAWRKGARILSPAPHGAPTSVLRRIRFRGTGCFALPLCWSVTRWFADGDGLANSVSAVQTTIITRAIPWRTGCTGRPHRRIHSNTGTIWKTTRTATRNSTYLPALGDSAQATRYRCRQL